MHNSSQRNEVPRICPKGRRPQHRREQGPSNYHVPKTRECIRNPRISRTSHVLQKVYERIRSNRCANERVTTEGPNLQLDHRARSSIPRPETTLDLSPNFGATGLEQ